MTKTHGLVLAIYFAMGSMAHAAEMPASTTGEVTSPAPDAVRVSGADLKAFGWTQPESIPSPQATLPNSTENAAAESTPSPPEGIAETPAPDPMDGRSASLNTPQPELEPSAPNVAQTDSSINPTDSESRGMPPLREQATAAASAQSSPPLGERSQTSSETSATPRTGGSTESVKAEAPPSTPEAASAPAIDVTPNLIGATMATPNATTPLPPNSTITEISGP